MLQKLISTIRSKGVSGYAAEKAATALMGPFSRMDKIFSWVMGGRNGGCPEVLPSVKHEGFTFLRNKFPKSLSLDIHENIKTHEYLTKRVLTADCVATLAQFIMNDDEIRGYLFGAAGVCYSLDYLYYSTIYPIPLTEQSQRWYANQWHTDLPMSDYTLKIFVLQHTTTAADGPFTFLDRPATKEAFRLGFSRETAYSQPEISRHLESHMRQFTGEAGDLCIASPHCIHRAGIPEPGHARELLMLQLNPAPSWGYRQDLFQRQYLHEPKFPLFRQFVPRVLLDRTAEPRKNLAAAKS